MFETKDKKSKKVSFDANAEIRISANWLFGEKKVLYLEKNKLLYLRIPAMNVNDTTFYVNQLQKIIQEKTVDNVVIDVRSNGGGDDRTWATILNYLLSKKSRDVVETCICNWKPLEEYHKAYIKELYQKGFVKDSNFNFRVSKVERLGKQSMLVVNDTTILGNEKNSFRGKVYVITDNKVYSSTGNLLSEAKHIDEVISVGLVNYKDLYQGDNPIFFALPNSRAVFSMNYVTNLHGIEKTPEDILNVRPEVVVKPTLQEMEDLYLPTSLSLEDYLYQKDVFFKKVLSLIENDKK